MMVRTKTNTCGHQSHRLLFSVRTSVAKFLSSHPGTASAGLSGGCMIHRFVSACRVQHSPVITGVLWPFMRCKSCLRHRTVSSMLPPSNMSPPGKALSTDSRRMRTSCSLRRACMPAVRWLPQWSVPAALSKVCLGLPKPIFDKSSDVGIRLSETAVSCNFANCSGLYCW